MSVIFFSSGQLRYVSLTIEGESTTSVILQDRKKCFFTLFNLFSLVWNGPVGAIKPDSKLVI